AEIAPQKSAHIEQVLLPQRLVEIVIGPHVLEHGRRQRPLPVERPARGRAQDDEADGDGDERDGQRREHPAKCVLQHPSHPSCWPARVPGGRPWEAGPVTPLGNDGPGRAGYSDFESQRVRWMSLALSSKPEMAGDTTFLDT